MLFQLWDLTVYTETWVVESIAMKFFVFQISYVYQKMFHVKCEDISKKYCVFCS